MGVIKNHTLWEHISHFSIAMIKQSRESNLEMAQGFETSKPTPSDVLLPVIPHLLDIPKQHYHLVLEPM